MESFMTFVTSDDKNSVTALAIFALLRLLFPENADRQGSIKLIKNTVTATNALSEGIDFQIPEFQIPENLRGMTRTEQSIALSIPLVIN